MPGFLIDPVVLDNMMEKNNMSKAPEHFKQYNHEHAQAGAPIGLRNGCDVKIHHAVPEFDKLIGMFYGVDGTVHAGEWNLKGAYYDFGHGGRLDIVMLPLGMCEGKPVFVGDKLEQRDRHNKSWIALDAQIGHKDFSISRWAETKPEYPNTRMTNKEINEVIAIDDRLIAWSETEAGLRVANAAIARAIEDGDVFTRDQVQAVIKECADIAFRMGNGSIAYSAIHGINWDDILKGALHG